MNKLITVLSIIAISTPLVSGASSFYQEAETKPKPVSTKPVITNYKGKLVAEKYRHQSGALSFNCPQGVVQFTTIEWPHKGKVSAQFTYAGGSSNIRGAINNGTNTFDGSSKEGEYFILHLKGVIKEGNVDGSIWFEIHNYPQYNANGICVANFAAYPTR